MRHYRITINYLSIVFATVMLLLALTGLCSILWTLFYYGLPGLKLTVFNTITLPAGSNGGLLNAIVGSLLITLLAILLGAPIGILIGTHIAEWGQHTWLAKWVAFMNDLLISTPSIIIGLFIYQIYVFQIGHFSGWAGCFALMMIVIPIVIRTTADILVLIPNTLREAAVALGAPQWKIMTSLLWPVSRTAILTGILLSLARISGETAPLLFTALNNQFWNTDMNQPMANLPSVIYQYAMSPYADWHQLAWTGALLVTLWILAINLIMRLLSYQKHPLY